MAKTPSNTKYCGCRDHQGTTALPRTLEFFPEDKKSKDGLGAECLECQVFASAKAKAELQREAWRKMQANIRLGNGSPHICDLTEEVVELAGGISGIAKRFWEDYNQTPEGSNTRLNYHREVIKLVQANTEGGYADKPVEAMSDQELAKFLLAEGARILPKMAGEVVDDHAGQR